MTVYHLASIKGHWRLLTGSLIDLPDGSKGVLTHGGERDYFTGSRWGVDVLVNDWSESPEAARDRVRAGILKRHEFELSELDAALDAAMPKPAESEEKKS